MVVHLSLGIPLEAMNGAVLIILRDDRRSMEFILFIRFIQNGGQNASQKFAWWAGEQLGFYANNFDFNNNFSVKQAGMG